jgi:hypothetical protein
MKTNKSAHLDQTQRGQATSIEENDFRTRITFGETASLS